MAWAAFTYLSAALHAWTHGGFGGAGTFARLVWDTADAVPPQGKLAFGAVMAFALYRGRRSWGRAPGAVMGMIAVLLAMLAIVVLAPVTYYAVRPRGMEWLGHGAIALLAGVLYAAARDRCVRATARRAAT